jgi:hypothetical protein
MPRHPAATDANPSPSARSGRHDPDAAAWITGEVLAVDRGAPVSCGASGKEA